MKRMMRRVIWRRRKKVKNKNKNKVSSIRS